MEIPMSKMVTYLKFFRSHLLPNSKKKKVREKSRECHNHKPQPFPDPKRKRKPTNLNKHKPNKCTKSTKISSLFPKPGNRNTKRTEKPKNKITHGKTYNKLPRRINHKATKSKSGSSIYSGVSGSLLDWAAEAPTYITITNCYVRRYVEMYTA